VEKTFNSVQFAADDPRLFFGDLLSMNNAKKVNLNVLPDIGKPSSESVVTGIGGFHLDMGPGQGAILKYEYVNLGYSSYN
jgi:hypothetical protein